MSEIKPGFWSTVGTTLNNVVGTYGQYEQGRLDRDTQRKVVDTNLAVAKANLSANDYKGPTRPTAQRSGSSSIGPQLSNGGLGMGAVIIIGVLFLLSKII